MIDKSKETCWIGLQEEPGAPIRVCTCHSYGGLEEMGSYLVYGFSTPTFKESWTGVDPEGAVLKRMRRLIEMKDVIATMKGKFFPMIHEFVPAGAGLTKDSPIKAFESFEAFSANFFNAAGIDYAYLLTIDRTPTARRRRTWAALTKITFDLRECFGNPHLRFIRLDSS